MALLAGAGGRWSPTATTRSPSAACPRPAIADLAFDAGLRVHELAPQRTTLEEVFMDLTREAVEYR